MSGYPFHRRYLCSGGCLIGECHILKSDVFHSGRYRSFRRRIGGSASSIRMLGARQLATQGV